MSCPGQREVLPRSRKTPVGGRDRNGNQDSHANRKLAQAHDAVPKEQMRSSYLRHRERGRVALPMLSAMCGYIGKAGRNSPAVSEALR